MKDRLITEISAHLETMRGASALAQKNIWDLKHLEMLMPKEQEMLGHLISHLVAGNQQLKSYIVLMAGYKDDAR